MGRSSSSSHRDDKDRKSDRKSSSRRRDRSPEDEDRRSEKKRSTTSNDDEELLRKAKEFVEREKRKSSREDDDDKGDDRRSSSKHHRKSSSRKSDDKKRHRREDDDDVKEDRSSSKKRRHGDVSDEESDRRRDRKHDKHESSSKHRRRSPDDDVESIASRDKDRKKPSRKDERKSSKHSKKEDSKKDRKDRKDEKKHKKKKDSKDNSNKPTVKVQKPDKSKLVSLGDPPGKPPSKLLNAEEDYFSFHQQLWVWLYREEGVAFNDLTSEESHEAFARFVQQYNSGQLEAAYYDEKGLPKEALEECKTTRHKWSFQTSETERRGLQMLQDGVRKLTEYSAEDKDTSTSNNTNINKKPAAGPAARPVATVAPRDVEDDEGRRRGWTAEERMANRVANKRLKQHVRTAEEELTGGRADYGRERQLEKKKELSAKMHGAAKDREDPGLTISDDALYGDGGHGASYQAALARERKRKEQREDTKQARIQELQQKEQNKQQAMLDMLGLSGMTPGQKIKIAPRNDGDAK